MNQTDLLKIITPKSKLGRIKLGEEDRICIEFANYLRQITLEGTFPYIWFHVPNQIGSYRPIHGTKQGWMGRHPGVPDFCFMGRHKIKSIHLTEWEFQLDFPSLHRSFFIEFKTAKGKLSESQKIFIEWSKSLDIPVHVCRSFIEAKNIIDELCYK